MSTPAKPPPIPPEASVEQLAAVLEDGLAEHGWLWTTAAFGRSGSPTILAVRNGRLLALVLTTTAGRPSPDELAWLGQIRRVAGCRGEAVAPANVQGALRLIGAGRVRDLDRWQPL